MPSAPPFPPHHAPASVASNEPAAEERLATLVYRSKAVAPLSGDDLRRLVQAARARNRAEAITGLLIYDEGYFFQWLEGPPGALGRVWDSIRSDPRHTSIDLLGEAPSAARLFAGWDMKLATRNGTTGSPAQDMGRAPRPNGESTGSPLAAHDPGASVPAPQQGVANAHPTAPSDPNPRGLPGGLSIRQSAARHWALQAEAALWPADPRANQLARLLIGPDPLAAADWLANLHAQAGALEPLCAALIEPAARALGDFWSADDCREFDVTLGLNRLQSAVRRLCADATANAPTGRPNVLVVPQPGEPHMLCAALDAELLWQAGWAAHCEFPTSDDDLQDIVAGQWFDALDLSLSAAFRRDHWLPRMNRTIASARSASRNPALVVVAGGRVFAEKAGVAEQVGADACSTTALRVGPLILQALRAQH